MVVRITNVCSPKYGRGTYFQMDVIFWLSKLNIADQFLHIDFMIHDTPSHIALLSKQLQCTIELQKQNFFVWLIRFARTELSFG